MCSIDVKEKVNKARNPLKSRLFRSYADRTAVPGKAFFYLPERWIIEGRVDRIDIEQVELTGGTSNFEEGQRICP